MARKKDRPTEADKEQMAPVDDQPAGDPALREGHDQIVEEAPGIGGAADMSAPMGDPGDLSALGRSAALPDDLGVGDDPALDDLTDPSGDLGSTLLDDLAGDLSDPTGGIDGMSDGSGLPVLDDQTGRAMDGDPQDSKGGVQTEPATDAEGDAATSQEPETPYAENYDFDHFGWPIESSHQDRSEPPTEPEDTGSDDDDVDNGPAPADMPIPPEADDGTGGEPDDDDFIGERGDVDPAHETEPAGGAGELIGGRGDVDPAPETEEQGAGELISGRGDIDPLEGESTLLGGDTGDLAEMTAEAELGDVEVEFDDSLADVDVGEDV